MRSAERFAFAALLVGAVGIGFAPIFVRLSELGPSATAFYRLFFALPVLWLWLGLERRQENIKQNQAGSSGPQKTHADIMAPQQNQPLSESSSQRTLRGARPGTPIFQRWMIIVAGLCFAADLALWHWSIKLTTVANATLLANFAPLFVTAGARIFFREKITFHLLSGMLLALLGGVMLVEASFAFTPRHVVGDVIALAAAVFYAAYLLAVKQLTQSFSTAKIMAWSGLVTSPALLVVTLLSRESLLATHALGWVILIALALISQVGGQGLVAYGLAHLPASFSSVTLLLQPVVATLLAWVILSEPLGILQALGGCAILAGIAVASQWRRS